MSKKYGGVDNGANLEDMQEAIVVDEPEKLQLANYPSAISWVFFVPITYFVTAMLLATTGWLEHPGVPYWSGMIIPLLPTLVRVVYIVQNRLKSKSRMKHTDC